MNQEDIIIKKCFTCIFDMEMPFVNLTEQILGDGDEKQQYMIQLIMKNLVTVMMLLNILEKLLAQKVLMFSV